jgi:hypothetical protein
MAEVRHGLDQVQRWMQAVITHPGGAAAGAGSEEAERFLDVTIPTLERVVTRSRSLSALDRLEIYANAYFARLLECLRSEFPVLRRAVGEEVFDEFAIGYLQSYPPRSYSLNRLGEHFARYLAEIRLDDGGDDNRWVDLIIDLAALEWAIGEVFDGPGCEGHRLLDAQQLWAVPTARQPAVILDTAPCLRLVALRYPLRDYYAALRDERDAVPPEPRDSFLALTRLNYVVQLHELTLTQYALLAALKEGDCLGRAIERIAAMADSEALASTLAEWFREWAAAGFFRAVIDPGSARPAS